MSRTRRSNRTAGNGNTSAILMAIPLLIAAMILLLVLSETLGGNMARNARGTASGHKGLYISEVMSDNDAAVPDENGRFKDWIEVWNSTSETMNLGLVGLSNRPDRIVFFFPDYDLGPGERVIVFCDKTNQNTYDKTNPAAKENTFHAKFSLSSLGTTVYLFDTDGRQLDSVTAPTLNQDEAYILSLDE